MYGCVPYPGAGVAFSGDLVLRAAVAAYLGRYRGVTRQHCESDLRVFLRWCTDQDPDPLAAVRVDVERYLERSRPRVRNGSKPFGAAACSPSAPRMSAPGWVS